ncbi:hypothetical protein DXT99_21790 [Pontibacter diazotrophicus]|uniref:Uncharacterized protein n=1 Tax=Pontibacter diazotrophicus TaxID=1400979 RepID=A0A3D8L7Q6_9BACT|nr:hypothetical protein [Pontibacter diazotrophicus]RDV13012.1 hypothetical protein DXT99_21790 [Pontibacter diazotrophicus]
MNLGRLHPLCTFITAPDSWVELEFDFSPYADRTDLNPVQISSVGGEGNFIPGIFFIDDIRVEGKCPKSETGQNLSQGSGLFY